MRRGTVGRAVRGLVVRAALAVAVAAGGSLAFSQAAGAHTYLNSSDPTDGASLVTPPHTLALHFSQLVLVQMFQIHISDGAGRVVLPTRTVVSPTDDTSVVVSLPSLNTGLYRVTYTLRDSEDLHLTSGTLVFGVGVAPAGLSSHPGSRPPEMLEVVLKGVSRGGLVLLLGALLTALVVLPGRRSYGRPTGPASPDPGGVIRRRLHRVSLAAVVAALAADSALVAWQASRTGPLTTSFARVVGHTSLGRSWLTEMILGVLLLAVLLVAGRERSSKRAVADGLAAALAVALAVSVAWSGHDGGAAGPTWWGTAWRTAHLVSVGAWLGTKTAKSRVVACLDAARPLNTWLQRNVG